jgi:ribonuclease BN (tRNA processing enzyme)
MSTDVERLALTVLGASPAYPNPGGACSGYLLRHGERALLLDCGSGVVGRLRQHIRAGQVAAIVISHLHPDHYADLIPYVYVLRYVDPPSAPIPLHLPPGGRARLARLGELVSGESGLFETAFALSEYAPGARYDIAGLGVTFHPVQHYVPSHAIRVRAGAGGFEKMFVFSSDVAPCSELVEAARDADLLLCEAALTDRSQDDPDPRRRGHLLAEEAGQLARAAGARRLVLTHYRADRPELPAFHRQAAERAFRSQVELAQEGATYTV